MMNFGALSRGVVFGVAVLSLTACVASTGPLTSKVVNAAANVRSDVIYEVIDVNYDNASLIAAYRSARLQNQFGSGSAAGAALIGAGDVLLVTIYEASSDGLFSTTDRKATPLTITVQSDGTASIPYVGNLRFSGQTVEQARKAIVVALQSKAIEPDATVVIAENVSRTVSVSGSVGRPGTIPLTPSGNRVTEVVAQAGGPTQAPYDTVVTVTRKGQTARVMMQVLLASPAENIFVRPGDQIFLSYDPQTFTVLGSTSKVGKVPFQAESLTLVEASALAGGGDASTADPKGYFVFRFESESIYRSLVGTARFDELVISGMRPDENGRYPIVYRLDLSRPESFLTGQVFPINNRDVVYISRSPSIDFQRFVGLISAPVGLAGGVVSVIDR